MKIIIQGPSLAWKTGKLDLIQWTAKVVKIRAWHPTKMKRVSYKEHGVLMLHNAIMQKKKTKNNKDPWKCKVTFFLKCPRI